MDSGKSNLRGPKTLEERLIEQVLERAVDVKPVPDQVRSVIKFQNGAGSGLFKYVDTQLKVVETHLDDTTGLLQKLEDLMGETSIVGQLSRREMKRRALHLLKKLGREESLKLVELIEQEEHQEIPGNVIFLDAYLARKQKERVLGLIKEPPGAA